MTVIVLVRSRPELRRRRCPRRCRRALRTKHVGRTRSCRRRGHARRPSPPLRDHRRQPLMSTRSGVRGRRRLDQPRAAWSSDEIRSTPPACGESHAPTSSAGGGKSRLNAGLAARARRSRQRRRRPAAARSGAGKASRARVATRWASTRPGSVAKPRSPQFSRGAPPPGEGAPGRRREEVSIGLQQRHVDRSTRSAPRAHVARRPRSYA